MFSRMAVVCLLLAAQGCATLSEGECRLGDWEAIGRQDGRDGRLENQLAQHFEACQRYGVQPDKAAYARGRQQGLQSYCTLDNAFNVGRSGTAFARVCPLEQERALLLEHEVGRSVHEREAELKSTENEIAALEKKLQDNSLSDAERQKVREQIRGLDQTARNQRQRLQDAETAARRRRG